jgi:acetyl/propionyl-CoA carboxylase alpha subunit
MEYDFRFEDKSLKVASDLKGGEFTADIDGNILTGLVVAINDNQVTLNINNRTHRAFVCVDDSRIMVHIDGKIIELVNTDGERKSFSAGDHEFGAKDRVMSPMPGKVVKILVAVGDNVAAKQPLVIVESMKMENEIKAPAPGVIKEIKFSPGDLVGTGQPIILLEPEA